jgi:hypothetical protein
MSLYKKNAVTLQEKRTFHIFSMLWQAEDRYEPQNLESLVLCATSALLPMAL